MEGGFINYLTDCKGETFNCGWTKFKLYYIDIHSTDKNNKLLYNTKSNTYNTDISFDKTFEYGPSISITHNFDNKKRQLIRDQYKINIVREKPNYIYYTLKVLTTLQLLIILKKVYYLTSPSCNICNFIEQFKNLVQRNINVIIDTQIRWLIYIDKTIIDEIPTYSIESEEVLMNAIINLECAIQEARKPYKPEPKLDMLKPAIIPNPKQEAPIVSSVKPTYNLKNFERKHRMTDIKDPENKIASKIPCIELKYSKSGLTEYMAPRSIYLYYVDKDINTNDNTYNKDQILEHLTTKFTSNFDKIEEKDKYKLILTDKGVSISSILTKYFKLYFISTEQLLLMLNRLVYINDHHINIKNTESIKKVIKQFISFIENNITIIKEQNIQWACFINNSILQTIKEDNKFIKHLKTNGYSDFDSLFNFLKYNILEDPTELNKIHEIYEKSVYKIKHSTTESDSSDDLGKQQQNKQIEILLKYLEMYKNETDPNKLQLIKHIESQIELNKKLINEYYQHQITDIQRNFEQKKSEYENQKKERDRLKKLKLQRHLTITEMSDLRNIEFDIQEYEKEYEKQQTQIYVIEHNIADIDIFIRDYTILFETLQYIFTKPILLLNICIVRNIYNTNIQFKKSKTGVDDGKEVELIDNEILNKLGINIDLLFKEYIYSRPYDEIKLNWAHIINVDKYKNIHFDLRLNNIMLISIIIQLINKIEDIDFKIIHNFVKMFRGEVDAESIYSKYDIYIESLRQICNKTQIYLNEASIKDKIDIYENFYRNYKEINDMFKNGIKKNLEIFLKYFIKTETMSKFFRTEEITELYILLYRVGNKPDDMLPSTYLMFKIKNSDNPSLYPTYLNGGNNNLRQKYLSYVKKYNL